jgi:hypothetical protein
MPEFLFSRRFLNIGGTARTLILACAATILGVIGGRIAISHYGTSAIELLIAIPLVIAITPRPMISFILLAGLLGSVFAYGDLPRANIPGHPPINVADVLLAIVVGATIWRRPWSRWPPAVRNYTLMLLLLLALASISSFQLLLHGHNAARSSILGYRNLLYLALPLAIALEFTGRLWRPLLNGLVALAALVAILSVAAAVSGSVAHLVTRLSPAAVMQVSGSSRVRLPGLFLAYAMSIPTLVMVLTSKDRWRPLRIVALALMIAAIAVSLNRNMYFGVVLGLLVAVLVGGAGLRQRVLLAVVIAVATLVLVVESVKPGAATEVEQRAGSALSTQVLSTGSAQARAIEFRFAFRSIARHPLDGVGWLQSYGLDVSDLGVGSGSRVYVEDLYIHLATDYGIPAALAFLLLPGFLLYYGVRRAARAADPVDRAMLAGAIGALVALLLSCLVGTYLQAPDSTASFAAACGLVLAAGLRASPRPPHDTRSLPAAPALAQA